MASCDRIYGWLILGLALLLTGQSSVKNKPAHRGKPEQKPQSKQSSSTKSDELAKQLEAVTQRLKDSESKLRAQLQRIDSAKERLVNAKNQLSTARESSEEYLDRSTGLPHVIAELRGARDELKRIEEPIKAQVRASESWKVADRAATKARQRRIDVQANLELSAEQVKSALSGLDAVVRRPEQIELAELARDQRYRSAKQRLTALESKVAQLQAHLPKGTVEKNPNYQRAHQEYTAARSTLAAYANDLTKMEMEHLSLMASAKSASQPEPKPTTSQTPSKKTHRRSTNAKKDRP